MNCKWPDGCEKKARGTGTMCYQHANMKILDREGIPCECGSRYWEARGMVKVFGKMVVRMRTCHSCERTMVTVETKLNLSSLEKLGEARFGRFFEQTQFGADTTA